MTELTPRQAAEKMVIESITDNIEFSIEFYKKELKQAQTRKDKFMCEHCAEMARAYSTLNFMVRHFKF